MIKIDEVVEPWADLSARLDGDGALGRWAAAEPVLAGAGTVSALRSLTGPGVRRDASDPIIAALVRLGAVDGADDRDASVVLLHLLAPGALRIAGQLRCDALSVLAELWCQIRTYPWQRRRRGFAAGLLLDTKGSLLADFQAARREVPVEPLDPVLDSEEVPDPADSAESPDPFVIIEDALRSGAVTPEDVELVLAFEERGSFGTDVAGRLARARGVCVRTVRRRRAVTLATLRRSVGRGVGAVA